MKKLLQKRKNNKGFSLVELIVVVAIMAVLIGVLVPTLVRNVEKSKKQKDISAVEEVRNQLTVALADEKYTSLKGTKLQPGSKSKVLKIEFEVSQDRIKGLLDNDATLKNFSEIFSYTTYYGK